MEKTSKDLLQFEHRDPSSSIESALLVCNKGSSSKQHKPKPDGKPLMTAPLPKSNVLSQVKDFLGVISQANKNLEMDAKDNPEKYDIEVLKDGESEYIEMDLMLGVADLQTPEAVSAAEAAINGRQPVINLPVETSASDSEESSEEEEEEDDESSSSESEDKDNETGNQKSKNQKDISSGDKSGRGLSKKRPKIVELP